ncbi:MAG: peptidylprolyl isomerase, partial [Acidobacteriota bacterium]|nr:peptidylprolyl isomerase [Acidobacteriota bacterium]
EEMSLIVKDFNPMQLKALKENPEQRKQLSEEIARLLSLAKEADREGITAKPAVKSELRFIESAVVANNYDQKVNENPDPQAGPFSSVTEEQVKAYWEATDVEPGILDNLGWKSVTPETREKGFQEFIDAKISLAKESGQMPEDAKPSEEELKMAKDIYAKTQITFDVAEGKIASAGELPEAEKNKWQEFKKSTQLQVKLQQAQFLAQYYGQNVLSKKLEVTDEDVANYLKENPELGDVSKKKEMANEVLKKLADGGDFATLAKEYSEDPGSKENGGLYEDVKMGQMNPAFEKAALALEPGTYDKNLVETNFGFHIIKLESKKETKDAEGKASTDYSVRHILISTQVTDPENPMSRPMPAKDFVKTKLQSEREKQLLEEIRKNNPVSVPSEFDIPEVSEEDVKKLLEQQQQMMGPRQGQQQPPPAPPKQNK